ILLRAHARVEVALEGARVVPVAGLRDEQGGEQQRDLARVGPQRGARDDVDQPHEAPLAVAVRLGEILQPLRVPLPRLGRFAPRSDTMPPASSLLSARPPTRWRASSTSTDLPRRTSSRAALRPEKPAPTMTTSAFRTERRPSAAAGTPTRRAPVPATPRKRRR